MNLVQLAGRHSRLTEELAIALDEVPRNAGRVERLTHELTATARALSAVRATMNATRSTTVTPTVHQGQRDDTHAWLGSFAGRLLQLHPSMSVGAAVRYAVLSIHHAAALDPHRAAGMLRLTDPAQTSTAPASEAVRRDTRVSRPASLLGSHRSAPASSDQPLRV